MGDKTPSAGASGVAGRNKTPKTPPNVTVEYFTGATETIQSLFGRELSDQELGMLVGAQNNSSLEVHGEEGVLYISQTHEHIGVQDREIALDENGDLTIHNDFFIANSSAPKGFGTKVFTDQVRGAAALGIKTITTTAGGFKGSNLNGYYTWPRMGYDGEIPSDVFIPPELRKTMKSNTIQELYRTQEGREYWKEMGNGISVTFDLAPNSLSHRVLDAYNEERANRKK